MATRRQKKLHRCAGCGETLAGGEQVASVSMGELEMQGGKLLVSGPHWGVMHRVCFLRAVRSPELILEELGSECS